MLPVLWEPVGLRRDDFGGVALMLSAARDIKPSVINTIPWIVEGLVGFLQQENKEAKRVLPALHLWWHLPSHDGVEWMYNTLTVEESAPFKIGRAHV